MTNTINIFKHMRFHLWNRTIFFGIDVKTLPAAVWQTFELRSSFCFGCIDVKIDKRCQLNVDLTVQSQHKERKTPHDSLIWIYAYCVYSLCIATANTHIRLVLNVSRMRRLVRLLVYGMRHMYLNRIDLWYLRYV